MMIRAAQPLGARPGGRAPRQNWGKFEAHKWGGFTGRLEWRCAMPRPRQLGTRLYVILITFRLPASVAGWTGTDLPVLQSAVACDGGGCN